MKTAVLDEANAIAHWQYGQSRISIAWQALTGPKPCGIVYDIRDRTEERDSNGLGYARPLDMFLSEVPKRIRQKGRQIYRFEDI